jgi:hypothetical protein
MIREPMTESEQKLVDKYEETVREQVNKLDPIGLFEMGVLKKEYDGEIREITLRLCMCKSVLDVAEIMYIVFAYCFDLQDASPQSKYLLGAMEIAKAMGLNNEE